MADKIYKPLVVTMAEEVAKRGASAIRRAAPVDWDPAYALASGIQADALTALIEDIEWYGETTVSVARLARFRDALAALGGGES